MFLTDGQVPRKNDIKDRVDAGLLQLAPGSHLILDETAMQPGRLQDQGLNPSAQPAEALSGVRNLMALQTLVRQQVVNVEFQHFGAISFRADVQTLVVSEGRSLIPVCSLPVASC